MTITAEQREFRLSGIGGSDAGVILRVSPFQEPYALYLEKTGQQEPADISDKEVVKWGAILEEPVAQAYMERTGTRIQRDNRSYRSKKYPFMIAHLDRKVVGEKKGVEVKTSAFGIGYGADGTNEIPPSVYAQVQHYMAVRNFPLWDVAVLIGGRTLRIYPIGRDDEFIARLIEAEEEFWDRVEAKVPPEPTWEHSELIDTIKRMCPGTNGSVVQLPEIAQAYADVWNDAKAQRLKYEKVEDGCKNRLKMLMGEASYAILPSGEILKRALVEKAGHTVGPTSYMNFSRTKTVPKLVKDAQENNEVLTVEVMPLAEGSSND